MPESASITNNSTFGLRPPAGKGRDPRWSCGCTDPQLFDLIISNNIQKPNNSELAMALPKTDPLEDFHIDGLVRLAQNRESARDLVKSWLKNYKAKNPERAKAALTDLSSEDCS